MISRSTEYALRIMALFALQDSKAPLRAKDIAEEINIPLAYLSKILRRMVNAGLLIASKGHGGGFIIAKSPQQIRFIHILEAVEDNESMSTCVFGWSVCRDRTPCILHQRWKQIKTSFNAWARETTLADVQNDFESIPYFNGKQLHECMRQVK